MDEDGNIVRIIANLRDFDLMQKIREELDNVYHPSVIEKIDKDNPIIALIGNLPGFGDGCTGGRGRFECTILGESGVGKEVMLIYS